MLKSPDFLSELQHWFASVITTPLDENDCSKKIRPSKKTLAEEASAHIVPSLTLTPDKRVEIYNQQYWWRLLNCLQDAFPINVRLFGYSDFNDSLAVPYLHDCPPDTWSLNDIGNKFPAWIKANYKGKDKMLVANAATLDLAFNHAFVKGNLNQPKEGDEEQKLQLQPHVSLLQFVHDLPPFRVELLKQEPKYWVENPFPKLEKNQTYRYVLFRNPFHQIFYKKIGEAEFAALNRLAKGCTLEELCDWIEDQPQKIVDDALLNFQPWFAEWTAKGIIGAAE